MIVRKLTRDMGRKAKEGDIFARLSTVFIVLNAIETYSCLTLSGFLAVSGFYALRKQNIFSRVQKYNYF